MVILLIHISDAAQAEGHVGITYTKVFNKKINVCDVFWLASAHVASGIV